MGRTHITWDGDEHEVLAGPDMQMIRRYSELAVLTPLKLFAFLGRQVELAPQRIDVLLLVVHPCELHHVIPDRRVSAVSPNHEVEADFDLLGSASSVAGLVLDFEPCSVGAEISTGQFVVEAEFDVGKGIENVEKTLVKTASVDGIDGLTMISVGRLEVSRSEIHTLPWVS